MPATRQVQFVNLQPSASALLVLALLAACTSRDTGGTALGNYVIQAPDGGDCEQLGGSWNAGPPPVCSMLSLVLDASDVLTIRRSATLLVERHFFNKGTVLILAGDPDGSASLVLGDEKSAGASGGGVNQGVISILSKAGFASPGFNNHFEFHNQGNILNYSIGGVGGILNNFATIFNSGPVTNLGFFHNSGPPVSTVQARFVSFGDAGHLRNETGTLENMGVIEGPVVGSCSGTCLP